MKIYNDFEIETLVYFLQICCTYEKLKINYFGC